MSSTAANYRFYEQGSLPFIEIQNQLSKTVISLYGGQVMNFHPHHTGEDLLWTSEKTAFQTNKAIRGGIPICFPWFGPHATDNTKAQHGFARLSIWKLLQIEQLEDGQTLAILQLHDSPETRTIWPFSFTATLKIKAGEALTVELIIRNDDKVAFDYSDALHTYLHIGDIQKVELLGLHHAKYYSAFGTELMEQQSEVMQFQDEVNRRYVQHTGLCQLIDPVLQRKITIDKSGSKVTVVWNPGEKVTQTIGDMTAQGFQTFACVEAVNAYPGIDIITLQPGEEHCLSTTIAVS